jgi:hypothetical protein
MSYQNTNLSIAGVSLAVQAMGFSWEFDRPSRYVPFIDDGGQGVRLPGVRLRVFAQEPPRVDCESPVFDAGDGQWLLCRQGDKQVLHVFASAANYYPRRLAILNADWTAGDIYITPQPGLPSPFPYPLLYPLEQLILLNLLARGQGVLLHASAVLDEAGRAFLLVGSSGVGKSTLSRLWLKQKGTALLNDDQVVVRRDGLQFMVYGTPWGGDTEAVSPRGAPVHGIFFLHHADHNSAVARRPVLAVSDLVTQSFPSFYSRAGVEFSLSFLGQLVQLVPCYDLYFVPEASAIDLLRRVA